MVLYFFIKVTWNIIHLFAKTLSPYVTLQSFSVILLECGLLEDVNHIIYLSFSMVRDTLNIYKLAKKKGESKTKVLEDWLRDKIIHLGGSKNVRKKDWLPNQSSYIFPL